MANDKLSKKERLSSGFINVSDVKEDNFNDGSSGFNQGKEEEKFEKDEVLEDPTSKKLRPLSAQLQGWVGVGKKDSEYYEEDVKKFMPVKLEASDGDIKPFKGHLVDPELTDLGSTDKPAA